MSNSSTTVQGVWYATLGAVGIVENILTAILIGSDRESRSPIFYYMINQCVADAVQLVSIGLYQGLVLADVRVARFSFENPGLSLWLMEVGMMEASIFMLLIALNRFRTLRSPTPVLANPEGTVRNWPRILMAWLVPPIIHAVTIFGGLVPLSFDRGLLDWRYDSEPTVGRAFKYLNLAYASACIVTVSLLNVISFWYVHSVRRKVRAHVNTIKMVAEIKLFVQCAVTATITAAVVIAYCVLVPFGKSDSTAAMAAHTGWILNHLHGPLIYLFMNARLRRRAARIMRCRCQQVQSSSFVQTGGGAIRVDRVQSIAL